MGSFASVVKQQVSAGDPLELLSPAWQTKLLAFFRAVRMQTAPMEDKHARNKKHNSELSAWSTFAAKFMISEAKQIQTNALHQLEVERDRGGNGDSSE